MRRRQLVLLGSATALTAPWPLRAQGQATARIGVMTDAARQAPEVEAMFRRLAELGWAEGRNLSVEYRSIVADPAGTTAAANVKEFVSLKCDLIVALATPFALATQAGAPSTPMVFGIGGDPVSLGLVASLARPGGNATGLTHLSPESTARMLGLLREAVPTARRVAVMFEAGNASMSQVYNSVQVAAGRVGVTLSPLELREWKDIDAVDAVLMRDPVDALLVLNDRFTGSNRLSIIRLADRRRLPAAGGIRFFALGGGLLSYGLNWAAQLARTADYVARILNGEKPANLPVEQPTRFELLVNLRTARQLGIKIPQSLLLQATEVIE